MSVVVDVLSPNPPTRLAGWLFLRRLAGPDRRAAIRNMLKGEQPGPIKRHSLGAYPVVDEITTDDDQV